MKSLCCVFALFWVASAAQAQLLPDPAAKPQLEPAQTLKPDPFAGSHQPYPRVYGANVADLPNDKALRIRRDPILVGGAEIGPGVSLEAGYAHLPEREITAIDPTRPVDASVPLAEKGASNHLALKYALPASERVTSYGKIGVAHDSVKAGGMTTAATRLHTGAGAKVKVDQRTTLDAEVARHGNAHKKLPISPDRVKAKLNMGF